VVGATVVLVCLGKFYMVSLALSCPQHPQNYCGGFGILQGKEISWWLAD